MLMPQDAGGVKQYPHNSPQGSNLRTRPQWLEAILYSGQVTRVSQHLALVLYHVADENGTAALSMRDIERITGWGRQTISDHLSEIQNFIHVTFGRGRAKTQFELQMAITEAVEEMRSVRQSDANETQNNDPSQVDNTADARMDTTPDASAETATKPDTTNDSVRLADAKTEMGGTIGGVTKNKTITKKSHTGGAQAAAPMTWAYNSADGFMGRVFEVLPENYIAMQATYGYLEFPAELAAADGFFAGIFDALPEQPTYVEKLTRLELYLNAQNRKAKQLTLQHDKLAAGNAKRRDDSCYFDLLTDTLEKAAGKIPLTLKGDELKKQVLAAFGRQLGWDKGDRERITEKPKEARGDKWKRKLTQKHGEHHD
jgi:hypothetical protein